MSLLQDAYNNSINLNVELNDNNYSCNNKYKYSPPRMSDGRSVISSWQPESAVNKKIIKENDIKSNWIYRNYLTKNSVSIQKQNFKEALNDTGYNFNNELKTINNGLISPYIFDGYNDTTQPFGNHKSNLKDIYLSREQLQSRKVAPVLTQEQLYNLKM